MLAALETVLGWAAQTIQTVTEFLLNTLSDMVGGFIKTAVKVWEELPQILAAAPLVEILFLTSLLLIYIGLKRRLQARGVIIFLFGLGILLIGLSNLVIPDVLPVFLRV